MQFQAYEDDCPACPLKARCLRKADQATPRQINFKKGVTKEKKNSLLEKMKRKIDSTKGRHIYRVPLIINGTFCISRDQIKNSKETQYNAAAQFF